MRNVIKLLLIPACIQVSVSCANNDLAEKKIFIDPGIAGIIRITITNREVYRLDMGGLGIEDGATISEEPVHASISTLARDQQSHLKYTYQAMAGFMGKDSVSVTRCLSIGTGACYASPVTKIIFTINN